jgi:hypothetical protein
MSIMRMIRAGIGMCLCVAASSTSATLIDFNSGVPASITLGGSMTWNSTGGGHLYMEQFFDDDFLFFSTPTTVNSFIMNSNPWEDYGFPTSGSPWLVTVEAFDISNNSLWSSVIDLTGYFTWDNWFTVNVGVSNVSSMTFYSPNNTHGVGFWPSIDNLRVNEQVNNVPEPASIALIGLGLLALGFRKRV